MSDYGFLSRTLHRAALGFPLVIEASFDAELAMYQSRSPDVAQRHHVFVAGLARAGTTILMRSLYETDRFCSLTYRDMPFLLAPNIWSRLARADAKKPRLEQRAHGDGIMIDYDSPEALEEVFWRVFEGEAYIGADCLIPHTVGADTIQRFLSYVGLILKRYDGDRYLSKNNNNTLRLPSIREAFPKATVLIPFRHPLQQANSLLTQHRLFLEAHREGSFSEDYMTWLVHHEFGADHRPFRWPGRPPGPWSPISVDYWLEQWVGTYAYLLDFVRASERTFLVGYELLCSETDSTWKALLRELELRSTPTPELELRCSRPPEQRDEALLDAATTIFEELAEYSREQLMS